jgi:VanZ family protein
MNPQITLTLACRIAFWMGTAAVFAVSVLPQSQLPSVDIWDKLQHSLSYGILGILGGLAYLAGWPRVFLGLAAMGGLLEIIQGYIPGRSMSWEDEVANVLGALVGVVIARVAARWLPVQAG